MAIIVSLSEVKVKGKGGYIFLITPTIITVQKCGIGALIPPVSFIPSLLLSIYYGEVDQRIVIEPSPPFVAELNPEVPPL